MTLKKLKTQNSEVMVQVFKHIHSQIMYATTYHYKFSDHSSHIVNGQLEFKLNDIIIHRAQTHTENQTLLSNKCFHQTST